MIPITQAEGVSSDIIIGAERVHNGTNSLFGAISCSNGITVGDTRPSMWDPKRGWRTAYIIAHRNRTHSHITPHRAQKMLYGPPSFEFRNFSTPCTRQVLNKFSQRTKKLITSHVRITHPRRKPEKVATVISSSPEFKL